MEIGPEICLYDCYDVIIDFKYGDKNNTTIYEIVSMSLSSNEQIIRMVDCRGNCYLYPVSEIVSIKTINIRKWTKKEEEHEQRSTVRLIL